MTERIALFEKELGWILLNSLWVYKGVGWSEEVGLVGQLGCVEVRIISNGIQ